MSALRRRQWPNGSGPEKGPVRLGSIILNSYGALGIEAKVREHKIKKLWKEAAGPGLNAVSEPARLIGKTLYCAVSSPVWMTELSYRKKEIIGTLNDRLKGAFITDIIIRHGDVSNIYQEEVPPATALKAAEVTEEQRRFIEETVEPVKDQELKEVIKRAMEKALS
ncbi:MAG: DUF721 domain-containing protein [Deltaproteobacteria bacterium]|nr:DUF721 domain-containing protein [Deltaproteobacteria bacterium]